MESEKLTPQVFALLEKVRIAVSESRFSEAERLMIEARALINDHNPTLTPGRRGPGWGTTGERR